MKNILFISGLLISSINTLISQNYLFNPNQSGPHLSVQYYNPGHLNTFVINPGFTFNGRLTTGLLASTTTGGLGLKYNTYGTNASYMIIKEGAKKMPFSLSIDGKYTFGKYQTIDARYKTLQLGPSIYKRINITEKFALIPGIHLSYDWSTTKSASTTYKNTYWGSVFQLSALYNKFQITASANKSINQNYFAIATGFILPL